MPDEFSSVLRGILLNDLTPRDAASAEALHNLADLLGRAATPPGTAPPATPEALRGVADLVATPEVTVTLQGRRGSVPAPLTMLRHEVLPGLLDTAGLSAASRNLAAELQGRFADRLGRETVIEVLRPVRKIVVRSAAGAVPWLLLTGARLPRPGTRSVAIRRSTVWIHAAALFLSATLEGVPADGHVGLLVESGTLELPANPTVSGDDLLTGVAPRGVLKLKLRAASGGGVAGLSAPPPEEITLNWTTRGLTVALPDTPVSAGGQDFVFSAAGGPRHDAARGRIVFGCKVQPERLDTALLHPGGAELTGSSGLADAGWAVPLTRAANPASLPRRRVPMPGWHA